MSSFRLQLVRMRMASNFEKTLSKALFRGPPLVGELARAARLVGFRLRGDEISIGREYRGRYSVKAWFRG